MTAHMPRSTDTPPSARQPSIASRLPVNCWTRILEHCQFDYRELKQVTRVCKKIKKAVKGKTLDSIVFRVAPIPHKSYDIYSVQFEPIPLHPILDMLCTGVFTSLRDAYWLSEEYPEEREFTDYPTILEEFATSPASSEITIKFQRVPQFSVKNPRGITVKQLLVGIANFWRSTPPDDVIRRVQKWDGYNEFEDGPITWVHALKGHDAWDGWKPARSLPNGYTLLDANDWVF